MVVCAASIADSDGTASIFHETEGRFPRLRSVLVAQGSKGWLVGFAKRWFGIIVDIVSRSPEQREFVVQPQRWKIEHTFGWLDWSRKETTGRYYRYRDACAVRTQYMWGLPVVRPEISAHHYHTVCCPGCGNLVTADRPADLPPAPLVPAPTVLEPSEPQFPGVGGSRRTRGDLGRGLLGADPPDVSAVAPDHAHRNDRGHAAGRASPRADP